MPCKINKKSTSDSAVTMMITILQKKTFSIVHTEIRTTEEQKNERLKNAILYIMLP